MHRVISLLSAAVLFAGCAGSNGGMTSLVPMGNATAIRTSAPADAGVSHNAKRHAKAKLTIEVHIPKRHHRRRGAHYISAATKGMTLAFTGAATFTKAFGLTPSSPGCSGTPLRCTITLVLASGAYKITASAYDAPPANATTPAGNLLSTAANVPATVVAGRANTFGLTLDGVVSTISFSGLPATGTAGTSISKSFAVVAKDADGNTIVGRYENRITISDTDTSGVTSVSTYGGDYPPSMQLLSSSDRGMFTYTGLATTQGATIHASAKGTTVAGSAFAVTLKPIGPTSLSGGVYINAYGASSPITFTASELGWTNSPYSKSLTASLDNNCANFVTVTPSSGTVFTATLIQSPVNGSTCTLTLSDGVGQQLQIPLGYQAFSYMSSQQTFSVPQNVTQLGAEIGGGHGATPSSQGGSGGSGGDVTAFLSIGNASTIYFTTGGGGNGATGGSNGGGNGNGTNSGAGGGGATQLYVGGTDPSDLALVAGGGGGGGHGDSILNTTGGAGGEASTGPYDSNANGHDGGSGTGINSRGGNGATTSAVGGAGANGTGSGGDGNAGSSGTGSSGGDGGAGWTNGTTIHCNGGGGGGGGYYGGGGSGGGGYQIQCGTAGGGGGGSDYSNSLFLVSNTSATFNTSSATDGFVVFTW